MKVHTDFYVALDYYALHHDRAVIETCLLNQESSKTALDFLIGISHSAPKNGGEDHLDVFWEGVVVEVVEVEADFVGEDYGFTIGFSSWYGS